MEILTIGEKIRRKRKSLRLTLKDVAGDNVTPAQLSYIESNKCKPSNSLLRYICDKIELDLSYVMESEKEQAQNYCDYYLKEYEFYIRRAEYEEAADILLNIEKLANEYKLDKYLGVIAWKRGIDSLKRNDYDSAEYGFLTAMQIFMKLEEYDYMADCYCNLGLAALNRHYLYDALKYFNHAAEIMEKDAKDASLLYKVLFNKARIYFELGEFKKFKYFLSLAVSKAKESSDNIGTAELLSEAALMTSNSSELADCDNYIDEAAEIYKSVGKIERISLLNIIKVMIHIKNGDYKTGTSYIDKLPEEISGINDKDIVEYLLKTAYFMLPYGYDERIEKILSGINENILSSRQNAMYLFIKSQLYKDRDKAKYSGYLIESTKFIYDIKGEYLPIKINTALGEFYKSDRKYAEALEYLTNGARLFSEEDNAGFKIC